VILPAEARPPVAAFVFSFTSPAYQRFSTLSAGARLTTGRRTVADLLPASRQLAPGHRTDYQRVLSRAPWSGLELGCALRRLVIDRLIPDGPVRPVGDGTADGHKGPKVYGKARHRGAVRSTHTYTAWRYGHKWVVLAVLVRFPFATRPWALPILIDLDRSAEDDRARKRRHRTPAPIMCGPSRLLLIRFPGRTFVFAGDSGYGTHEVARFCHRRRARRTLVSKWHPDANPFDPPPPYAGNGRPRLKGQRRLKPRQAAGAAESFTRLEVGWYGGGERRVDTPGGTGHWHKGGRGPAPSRPVFVRDVSGTPRDEYFFTTDPGLAPSTAIGHYGGRGNTETTSQEARSGLGLETTRGWREKAVWRAGPCPLGLYSVVALVFHMLPEPKRTGALSWPGKATATFSGALCAVRRWLWAEATLPQAGADAALDELPTAVRELLLTTLAPAA